jgi:hypothetical protein
MKQEISPRVVIAAVAVVLVLVVIVAWNMLHKPQKAVVVVNQHAGTGMQGKMWMREQIDRSARTAPGSYVPQSSSGNP